MYPTTTVHYVTRTEANVRVNAARELLAGEGAPDDMCRHHIVTAVFALLRILLPPGSLDGPISRRVHQVSKVIDFVAAEYGDKVEVWCVEVRRGPHLCHSGVVTMWFEAESDDEPPAWFVSVDVPRDARFDVTAPYAVREDARLDAINIAHGIGSMRE